MRLCSAAWTTLVLLLASGESVAQESPAPASAIQKQDDSEKLVCKRLNDGSTGSAIRKWKKVCQKKSEWTAAANNMEDSLRRQRDRGAADLQGSLAVGSSPQP